jgi:hypothetical protein
MVCGYKYDVRMSKLAMILHRSETHAAIGLLLVILAALLTGMLSVRIANFVNFDVLGRFFAMLGVDHLTGSGWWLSQIWSGELLLGLSVLGNAFYLPYLYDDFKFALFLHERGEQRHIWVFLAWMGSLAQSRGMGIRLALIGGSIMAFRRMKIEAKHRFNAYSLYVCSQILNVN